MLDNRAGSTVMVPLTIHRFVNPLWFFSLSAYALTAVMRPCNIFTVLSQVNADIYKIRFRKWSLKWVKERKGFLVWKQMQRAKAVNGWNAYGSFPPSLWVCLLLLQQLIVCWASSSGCDLCKTRQEFSPGTRQVWGLTGLHFIKSRVKNPEIKDRR